MPELTLTTKNGELLFCSYNDDDVFRKVFPDTTLDLTERIRPISFPKPPERRTNEQKYVD